MSVETLRQAIAERTKQLLASRLEAVGLVYHKKHWRDCPCSWCETKREATVVVGHTRGHYESNYVDRLGLRTWVDGREPVRQKYRSLLKLKEMEGEG